MEKRMKLFEPFVTWRPTRVVRSRPRTSPVDTVRAATQSPLST